MEKLDLTKHFKTYYTAKAKPELLTIEPASYLSITGKGDPSGADFTQKIQAIYPVAYALKFACKARNRDFVVAKLEAQWWYDEARYQNVSMADSPKSIPRSEWEYRLLIRMPDYVSQEDVASAIAETAKAKGSALISEVRFFAMTEGKVAQILHTGPFDTEPETLDKLKQFMTEHGLARNGLHHEIYLSDFRKTPPARLKTILREPVK